MRRQLSIIVLFLSPALVCFLLYADWSMILEPFLPHPPSLTMPAPQIFPWILRCSHDYTCFVSLLFVWHDFLRPYFIVSRPIVHVSHILRAHHYFFSLFHIITLSAHPFADILDINTSRDPRVTSLALIVVRLHPRTIPMFLRRHSTLLIMLHLASITRQFVRASHI